MVNEVSYLNVTEFTSLKLYANNEFLIPTWQTPTDWNEPQVIPEPDKLLISYNEFKSFQIFTWIK